MSCVPHAARGQEPTGGGYGSKAVELEHRHGTGPCAALAAGKTAAEALLGSPPAAHQVFFRSCAYAAAPRPGGPSRR